MYKYILYFTVLLFFFNCEGQNIPKDQKQNNSIIVGKWQSVRMEFPDGNNRNSSGGEIKPSKKWEFTKDSYIDHLDKNDTLSIANYSILGDTLKIGTDNMWKIEKITKDSLVIIEYDNYTHKITKIGFRDHFSRVDNFTYPYKK